VRAITPELEAILKSKFLAGASGFRGRIEISSQTAPLLLDTGQAATGADVVSDSFALPSVAASGEGIELIAFIQTRPGGALTLPAEWTTLLDEVSSFSNPDGEFRYGMHQRFVSAPASPYADVFETAAPVHWLAAQLAFRRSGSGPAHIGSAYAQFAPMDDPTLSCSFDDMLPATEGSVLIAYSSGTTGAGSGLVQEFIWPEGWTEIAYIDAPGNLATGLDAASVAYKISDGTETGVDVQRIQHNAISSVLFLSEHHVELGVVLEQQVRRISIDKARKMSAAAMTVELDNADGSLSRYPSQAVAIEGNVIKAYEWYGDVANEVRTFTGVIDKILEHEDPSADPGIITITCRDRMKHLLVESFSAAAPQGADEDGAVRTTANGVFLNMEVSDIVGVILDMAGIASTDRAISPTSYMVDEYVLPDGISWAEAILGINRLTDLVGYELWADEDGIIRFAPSGLGGGDTEVPDEPSYTYRVGEDLTELDLAGDDYDLATRVKVRGPLTTNKPAWAETWHTNAIALPVGLFYDAADPTHLYVLDRSTKKLYKLLQSDRSIVSSVTLTGITHPLGVSGDPSDGAIYWILEAPWKYTGSTTGNKIHKVRRSDQAILATYNIANGRWTSIKVSASFIWLANWDTDKIHKHSKADGSSIASYTVTFEAVAQTNPTGIAVDGTTLLTFFYGMSGGNRFLLVDESDPTTVDPTNALGVGSGVISTAGTNILGGEMDTTTHADLYACSDDLGLVWKFALVEPVDETVAVVVADVELEDELGAAALIGDRTHDLTHDANPPHPYEIRRLTFDLKVITSIAQATESATRLLARYSQRRVTLDVGTIGNPAQQLRDMVAIDDPVASIDEAEREWMVDTLRTELDAEAGTFLAVMALLPWEAAY